MQDLRYHLNALQKEGMSIQKLTLNAGMNNAQYQRVLKFMSGTDDAINDYEVLTLRTHLIRLAESFQSEILNDEND